ncbi:dermonecrotic toxin domain-containing protein [Pseudomonas rhodesiae]|uniref:dermonecrotic toxin domain-containing protein n=1 Tax=Pseudomonas rhodesiae TaxID=76760 RepID=UPI0032B1368F
MRTVQSPTARFAPVAAALENTLPANTLRRSETLSSGRSKRASPDDAVTATAKTNADLLVKDEDYLLSCSFSAALMDRAVALLANPTKPPPAATIDNIPANSTFGQALARFNATLKQEPFASFARNKKINLAHFKVFPSEGRLEWVSDGVRMKLTRNNPAWNKVSADLLAAARELTPTLSGAFEFTGAHSAPVDIIGDFYASPRATDLPTTLRAITRLKQYRDFPALHVSTEPGTEDGGSDYQRIRQKQRETIVALATALSHEPEALPASRRNLSPTQTVEQWDRALAHACAIYLYNQHSASTVWNDAIDILGPAPASTFGVAWSAYRQSLSSEAFKGFAKDKGIDIRTLRIEPQSGALSAVANGRRIRFTLEDDPAWAAVATPILEKARAIAAGSPIALAYPESEVAPQTVLNFYGEPVAHATQEETLKHCAALHRSGFDALRKDEPPSDERSHTVQARRAAAIEAVTAAAQPPNPNDAYEQQLLGAFTAQLSKTNEDEAPAWVRVPTQTALGQWLELYRSLFDQPAVQEWMQAKGFDLAQLELIPSTGTLLVKKADDVTVLSPTDTSGWGDLAGPIVKVAQVIAPSPDQSLQIAPGNAFIATPVSVVADFQGETPQADSAAQRARIAHLNAQKAFDPIAADDPLRPAASRSAAALADLNRQAQAQFAAVAKSKADKRDFATLMFNVNRDLPDVRQEAKKWAEAIILKATGKPFDADNIYLNRFYGSQSADTQTGWEHMGEEPHSSLRLPDALLNNFSENDAVPYNLDSEAGLYLDGPGKSRDGGYGKHNEFPLPPSRIMHEAWSTDFQKQMSDKLDTFWTDHADEYRDTLKGQFIYSARDQFTAYEKAPPEERAQLPAAERFTRSDYELVMKAAANVPLDPKQPLPLEALQARTSVKDQLRVHALDINGFKSTDILRFADLDDGQYLAVRGRRDGRQILYIPGHTPEFLRFSSLDAMDRWICNECKDPVRRKAFASHFSLADRQDKSSSTVVSLFKAVIPLGDLLFKDRPEEGVETSLRNLSTGDWSNLEGTVIDRGNFRITGDVFDSVMRATCQRMSHDADVSIKSNDEVTRDTWLNDLSVAAGLLGKLAPIAEPVAALAFLAGITEGALGLEKSVSGDTEAERRDGAAKALDGVLNTLFSIGAADRPEDPFSVAGEGATTRTAVGDSVSLGHGSASGTSVIATPLPVGQQTFADGAAPLVIEQPLSSDAYTIARSNGFDLVDGEKVYRYETDQPGLLNDLESTERTNRLDQFENICPAPTSLSGRAKRGANDMCFIKALEPVTDAAGKELQSLEHTRLFPAPRKSLFNGNREVIFEKRINRVVDTELGSKLVPLPGKSHIKYKTVIKGDISKNARFGMYDNSESEFLRERTYVVKLGKISNACNDSREVRGVVVSSSNPADTRKYLIVEADTAEFYKALITDGQTGKVNFIRCEATESDLDLVKQYRSELTQRQGAAAVPFDSDLVALPPLDKALKLLKKNGYTDEQIQYLKSSVAGMTAEQKREVVYQLQSRHAIEKPDIALKPARVRPLTKSSRFSTLTAGQENEFYAKGAKESVNRGLQATGLGPGNQVRSARDIARAEAAADTVAWMRRTTNPHAPNRGDMILKAGAGNCGEMSQLSKAIVTKSGGRAYEWAAGNAHAFTVIGGPVERPPATRDFSEAIWRDAWIVDPWTDIACPAHEYTDRLKAVMTEWQASGLKIVDGPTGRMDPTDPHWLDQLINQPKQPYQHAYETPEAEEAAA